MTQTTVVEVIGEADGLTAGITILVGRGVTPLIASHLLTALLPVALHLMAIETGVDLRKM
jgi:hypothetical protein